MRTRLIIVDDHPFYRMGLKAELERHLDFTVVGEASRAREAVLLVAETRPDLVLMDVSMPGMSGIDAIADLRRTSPRPRVVMLSVSASEGQVARALAAQASGYLLKDDPVELVVEGLRAVAAGQRYLSPTLAHMAPAADGGPPPGSGPFDKLSRRERVIFDLLVRGASNAAIAAELFISEKTVLTHRSHILRKLRLHSIADLVRYAVRNGEAL